jgi:hypothetical protein
MRQSANKRNIITEALPYVHSSSDRSKWRVRDVHTTPAVEAMMNALQRIEGGESADVHVFTQNDRKVVFGFELPGSGEGAYVAKVFYFNKLRRKLKYYRYAKDEAANLLTAADRNINAPILVAYGQLYGSYRFQRAGIIIVQSLSNRLPMRKLLAETDCDQRHARLMSAVLPLFVSLYRAACNHIDVSVNNVLLADNETSYPPSLVDFQHAIFHDQPSTEVLMFEAGYFARTCAGYVNGVTIADWLDQLLDKIAVNNEASRLGLKQRFDYYFQTTLSRKQRKKIPPL